MIRKDLLEILRCPVCVKNGAGSLRNYKESYLICGDCGRKYPIVEDIPVMLLDEGSKYIETPEESLAIPPVLSEEVS